MAVPSWRLRFEPADALWLALWRQGSVGALDKDAGGLVFFIDGDKACTPMRAPPELMTLMDEVATDKINHEGSGL
jgi:hypothetical protein